MMLGGFLSADLSLLRFFNGDNSVYFDALVPILTSGLTWIPLYVALFYLVVKNHETMAQIGLVVGAAVVCVFLAGGVGDFIVKPGSGKVAPMQRPNGQDAVEPHCRHAERKLQFLLVACCQHVLVGDVFQFACT